MASLKTLIFDLDDTLIDTTGTLIPRALDETFTALSEHGLKGNKSDFLTFRSEYLKENPLENLFPAMIRHFGYHQSNISIQQLEEIAYEKFFCRSIDSNLQLMPGAFELLETLSKKYTLYLVTSGNTQTQEGKVQHLSIQHFFRKIFYIPSEGYNSKKDAFKYIIEIESIPPTSVMSIGNRPDQEILSANELDMQTCLLRHGEFINYQPHSPLEVPNFEIHHIGDLKEYV